MLAENVKTALLLTTAAGLSTSIGSFMALMVKKPGPAFMSFTLGFSGGVMVLVSFVGLLPNSIGEIGFLRAHVAFFAGMACFFLLDLLIPHEYIGQHDHHGGGESHKAKTLERTGMLVAVGIALHNFPEGMATFAGALHDTKLGVAIAVAIAIHNIPEGIAVSVPVYAATGNRGKAFLWSFLSGVSEPVGAAVAAVVLMPYMSPALMGWMVASVAGVMVAISLDELVPAAKSFGNEHLPILGVIAGMAVMAFSLWLLNH